MGSLVSGQFVATSGTSATAIAATLPSAPTQGNKLIAMVDCAGAVTPTAASGWNKLTQIQSTDTGALFWHDVGAGESATQTLTSAGTGSSWGVVLIEVTGLKSGAPSVQNNQASTTTSKASPSVTPTSGVAGFLVGGAFSDGARTWSASAFTGSNVGSVTNHGTGSRGTAAAGESATLWTAPVSSTTGSYSATVTCSAADGGGAAVAFFEDVTPRRALVTWAEFEVPDAPASTPKSGTDSGTGTEGATALVRSSSRTDSGTRTETASVAGTLARSDSGTRTETATLVRLSSRTDVGTGAEGTTALQRASAVSDSATRSETASLVRSSARTDSATGSDTATLVRLSSRTDSASMADLSSLVALNMLAVSDSATRSETASLVRQSSRTDSASGTDSAAGTATGSRSDSGALGESVSLVRSSSRTDSATLGESAQVDVGAVQENKSGSDAGTLGETAAVQRASSRTDSGAELDSSALVRSSSRTDSATGADSAILARLSSRADSATLAEASAVTQSRARTDSGVLGEAYTLVPTVAAADSGTAIDSASLGNEVPKFATDTGTRTESAAVVSTGMSRVDSGTLGESASIVATSARADTGLGADVRILGALFTRVDAATLADIRGPMAASFTRIESGSVAELASGALTAIRVDSGTGSDSATVAGDQQRGIVVGSIRARDVVGSLATAGVDGTLGPIDDEVDGSLETVGVVGSSSSRGTVRGSVG